MRPRIKEIAGSGIETEQDGALDCLPTKAGKNSSADIYAHDPPSLLLSLAGCFCCSGVTVLLPHLDTILHLSLFQTALPPPSGFMHDFNQLFLLLHSGAIKSPPSFM